jgi:hypothetical protein
MSTSTKKGIPQTLILKSFLPHPTLLADNSLPLAAFDIDFFITVTKEESDDSYQNILSTEKSLVKDHYQDLPIGDNMAEIEQDQHTNFLASIHSTSYSNDIAAVDQEMKPTHNSKCFWITSPSQTIGQDISSQQTIASSEKSNILPSNVPAKRKLHLDDQDNLRQDEIADMDRDEKLFSRLSASALALPTVLVLVTSRQLVIIRNPLLLAPRNPHPLPMRKLII